MKSWKGCRGFAPEVHCQITNAMPPYLIENEARSPFPFSASSNASMLQHMVTEPNATSRAISTGGIDLGIAAGSHRGDEKMNNAVREQVTIEEPSTRKTTCWEILTIGLGHYAREQIASGIVPCDSILQQEARRLLFGDYDPWNQTAADNPEWLALFKKAHGIANDSAQMLVKVAESTGRSSNLNSSGLDGTLATGGLDKEDMMDLGIGDLSFDHHL